ncbi:MAG: ABC transporter ATP-binding protein [Firmicutes bacterium]|nr:ABC transporter ATP-binding protein [Bacillota bacterium]
MSKKTKEKDPMRLFGIPKMMPLILKYKKPLLLMCLFTSISNLAAVAAPVFQRYAINHYVEDRTLDTIWIFIGLYVLSIVIMAWAGYQEVIVGLTTEMHMDKDMRNKAFSHLQELAFSYYNQNSVGYIHSRVMSDTSRIGDLFSWQVHDTVAFAVYIGASIIIMFITDWKLTLLAMAIVPVITVFFSVFQMKYFELHREVRELNSKITGDFNEGITGAKTTKSLVIEDKIFDDFRKDTDAMVKKSIEQARLHGVFHAVTIFASSLAVAIVLWKGGILAKEEIGTFSMFMSYAENLMEPVRWLVDTLALFVAGKVNIERYTRLCETVSDVTDTPEVIEKYGDSFDPKKENWEDIKGDIRFDDVSFKYPDGGDYVLEHFDLDIPFGTNLAIVGETGAGKSTLASLICRFYEPTSGRVLIDGKDARERSQLWLHSSLGYVLQTPHLFSGSIRDNLKYGNEDATDEELWKAIDLVSARNVIEKLEKGLDTDVGEGGDMLSTGEKQLISFARAILADPKIIVLDEATASVDTLTEARIQAAIDTVIKGRTSIVIAHRLSTVRNADHILVVAGGKIIESGKHEDLLAAGGHYYQLWTRQFEDAATAEILNKN